MPNLRITAHGQTFELGDVQSLDYPAISSLLTAWFTEIRPDAEKLQALADALNRDHDTVAKVVTDTPST